MLLTAPESWVNDIAKQSVKTNWAKVMMAEDPAIAMDEVGERLEAQGVSNASVRIAYLTVGPLLAEWEAIAEYRKINPRIAPVAPEILTYQEAIALATMEYRLTEEEQEELLHLLKTDEQMAPLEGSQESTVNNTQSAALREVYRHSIPFEDIAWMLRTVWDSGCEKCWYEMAWEKLTEQGLTSRNDEQLVYIRAIALSMLYNDFCEVAWEEPSDNTGYGDMLEGYISDLELGIMYGELPDHEKSDDKDYVVAMLAQAQREKLVAALTVNSSLSKLVLELSTTITNEYTDLSWCHVDEDGDAEPVYITTCDEFKRMLEERKSRLSRDCSSNAMAALEWLENGMELCGEYAY